MAGGELGVHDMGPKPPVRLSHPVQCPTSTLRPFHPDDLHSLVKHANDPSVAANLTDSFPHPFTEAIGREFIQQAMQARAPATVHRHRW
jgi:hypothetical protein